MIICFNCSPEIKKMLDNLVEHQQYKDYAEAISAAVMNLAVLQEELSSKGAVVIGSDELESARTAGRSVKGKVRTQGLSRQFDSPTSETAQLANLQATKELVRIPSLFQLDGANVPPPAVASLPEDNWSTKREIPLDRWIFGQYNKLLPAKASVRALKCLLEGEGDGILLEAAASRIAEEAAVLGDFLAYHDEQNQIRRDDALSIAFPSTSPDAEKGRLRYASHFVASANKQGQLSGLLVDLKLINHMGAEDPRLMLTEAGWRFASLKNPVLDNLQSEPTQKFTPEETAFLLEHIVSSVPVENFAYHTILSAIAEGANTPNKIDAVLQRYIARDSAAHLSKSFLATQRSGAISRMADLGLVSRVRSGVKVSYIVTKRAQGFMRTRV